MKNEKRPRKFLGGGEDLSVRGVKMEGVKGESNFNFKPITINKQ